MTLFSIPTPELGRGFFTACRPFHPLDHQSIVTQTAAVTHRLARSQLMAPMCLRALIAADLYARDMASTALPPVAYGRNIASPI